jgi:single-strand DNA-binding protein
MANFNKVILAGNLTRDPELRYTPKGMAIAKLGLAINRSFTTESGEKRDEVTFVDVDAFGRQAEVIGQYMRKGRPILIEGRLRLDQWEDKTTHQKKSRLGVVLESFSFLDSGRGEGSPTDPNAARSASASASASAPASAAATPTTPAPEPESPPAEEDDVPF